MNEYAVTVIGHDRPGIIADVAEILAGLGFNLTDSTMTLLRGHFAMTLICASDQASPDAAADADAVRSALEPLGLPVTVREVDAETTPVEPGTAHVLTLHGADRLGIVAALCRTVAAAGGNITDLTTRLAGTLYVIVAELDVPGDATALDEALHRVAAELGVDVTLRPSDADLM